MSIIAITILIIIVATLYIGSSYNNVKLIPDPTIAGVILEFDQNKENNNTLVTIDRIGEEEASLLCLTDWKDCCVNKSDLYGSWFLPNGSKVPVLTTSHEQFYVTRGNQTVGLNRAQNSSLKLSPGIYHCEMVDKNNFTHYLYAGIYPENEGNTM